MEEWKKTAKTGYIFSLLARQKMSGCSVLQIDSFVLKHLRLSFYLFSSHLHIIARDPITYLYIFLSPKAGGVFFSYNQFH